MQKYAPVGLEDTLSTSPRSPPLPPLLPLLLELLLHGLHRPRHSRRRRQHCSSCSESWRRAFPAVQRTRARRCARPSTWAPRAGCRRAYAERLLAVQGHHHHLPRPLGRRSRRTHWLRLLGPSRSAGREPGGRAMQSCAHSPPPQALRLGPATRSPLATEVSLSGCWARRRWLQNLGARNCPRFFAAAGLYSPSPRAGPRTLRPPPSARLRPPCLEAPVSPARILASPLLPLGFFQAFGPFCSPDTPLPYPRRSPPRALRLPFLPPPARADAAVPSPAPHSTHSQQSPAQLYRAGQVCAPVAGRFLPKSRPPAPPAS